MPKLLYSKPAKYRIDDERYSLKFALFVRQVTLVPFSSPLVIMLRLVVMSATLPFNLEMFVMLEKNVSKRATGPLPPGLVVSSALYCIGS